MTAAEGRQSQGQTAYGMIQRHCCDRRRIPLLPLSPSVVDEVSTMSQAEQPKLGELIPADRGEVAPRPKNLLKRVADDVERIRRKPVSQGQPCELDVSSAWRCRATLIEGAGRSYANHSSVVSLSRDGTILAAADEKGRELHLWGLPEALPLGILQDEHAFWFRGLAISPDNQFILSGCVNGVMMSELPTGRPLRWLSGARPHVHCLEVSSNWILTAAGDYHGKLFLWMLPDGDAVRILEGRHSGVIQSLAICPDGRFLASSDAEDRVLLWELPDGKLLDTLQGRAKDHAVMRLSWSPDGKLLAWGDDNGVCLWILPEGKLRRLIEGESAMFSPMAISPNGRLLAVGRWDSTSESDMVSLWSLPDGAALQPLKTHRPDLYLKSLLISPDGQLVAGGLGNGGKEEYFIHLWRLQDGKPLGGLKETDFVTSLAMTPDGRNLISVGQHGAVRLWGS
jgi:WD40 repeat protein